MGWPKFLSSLLGIGGAPFTGGASLALLGIEAGSDIASTLLKNHGTTKAVKAQEEAARKAQAINERVYTDQKALMAPYMAFGTDAMQRYGDYIKTPFNERLASLGQPYNPLTARGGPAYQPPQAPPPAPAGPAGPLVGRGDLGFGRTGAPGLARNRLGMDGGGADVGFGGGGGGGMVQIQAPDGSVRPVPAQLVDRFIAKGGKVVG